MAALVQIAELFWQTLGGTMGYVGSATNSASAIPVLDFTAVTTARFRKVDKAGAEVFWAAMILTTPVQYASTSTQLYARHPYAVGDLAAGDYGMWMEVSLDGGTSWYASDTGAVLRVIDTKVPVCSPC